MKENSVKDQRATLISDYLLEVRLKVDGVLSFTALPKCQFLFPVTQQAAGSGSVYLSRQMPTMVTMRQTDSSLIALQKSGRSRPVDRTGLSHALTPRNGMNVGCQEYVTRY